MGEALLVRPREEVVRQLREALTAMEESGAQSVNEFAEKDYPNFQRLVEAWVALFGEERVERQLIEKADLRPVREVVGLP
jgi:hypothetical protein